MDELSPLRTEPLTYQQLTPQPLQVFALRVLAIVGIFLGLSRVLMGCFHAWVYGLIPWDSPNAKINFGPGGWPIGVTMSLELLILGTALVVTSIGLLSSRRWAIRCLFINEIVFAVVACALAFWKSIVQARIGSPEDIYLLMNSLSNLASIGMTLPYSAIVILLLRRMRIREDV